MYKVFSKRRFVLRNAKFLKPKPSSKLNLRHKTGKENSRITQKYFGKENSIISDNKANVSMNLICKNIDSKKIINKKAVPEIQKTAKLVVTKPKVNTSMWENDEDKNLRRHKSIVLNKSICEIPQDIKNSKSNLEKLSIQISGIHSRRNSAEILNEFQRIRRNRMARRTSKLNTPIKQNPNPKSNLHFGLKGNCRRQSIINKIQTANHTGRYHK